MSTVEAPLADLHALAVGGGFQGGSAGGRFGGAVRRGNSNGSMNATDRSSSSNGSTKAPDRSSNSSGSMEALRISGSMTFVGKSSSVGMEATVTRSSTLISRNSSASIS